MDPAQPIQNSEQDVFERLPFVRHLAGFLSLKKNAPSIVVGIEGKWGDGKTSCINLIKEVLRFNKPKPIVVEYRPWLISTLDSIIEGFFLEMASAIGVQSTAKNARTAAHKVLQFGKMLAPIKLIPGVEPWGSMVESVLSSVGGAAQAGSELGGLSLQSRKNDLDKCLSRVNRPIVVIIDDIDRLPPDHVRIVFQMLKAVCDFKRVVYLVAYDPEPVKKALSYDSIYEGERYLEKIIQVGYPLPRLSFIHMKTHLQKQIEILTKQCGIYLDEDESKLFDIVLNETDLVRVLETPRDAVRLCNRLRLSAPNTRDEVSFADLIAFETLELKFEALSRKIRTEPDRFVSTIGVDKEFASFDSFAAPYRAFAKEEEEKKIPLDGLFQELKYDKRQKDSAESLLLFLFPRLGGKGYHERDIPQGINRVQNRDAFLKLLHCGVASFTYSAEQAKRFFNRPDERRHILVEYIDEDDLYNWLGYITNLAVESKIEDPIQLCQTLIALMKGPESGKRFDSLAREAGIFLYEIIKSRDDSGLRWKMLNELVLNKVALAVSESALLQFLNDFGIWQNGKFVTDSEAAKARSMATASVLSLFSYKQLYIAKDQWLQSVRDVAASENLIKTQKNVLDILYRWGQLNDNDFSEPQCYVIKHSADNEWLKSYLQLFNVERNGRDILPFIPEDDLDRFIERVKKLAGPDSHESKIANFLIQVKKSIAEKENPPGS